MVNGESPFYLAVNNLKLKSLGTKNWLKANAVGINKISSLMKTMDQQAGFENNRLRNHSSRKTMIHSAPTAHQCRSSSNFSVFLALSSWCWWYPSCSSIWRPQLLLLRKQQAFLVQGAPFGKAVCLNCRKKGHFAKVCKEKPVQFKDKLWAAVSSPTLATVPGPTSLSKSLESVNVNGLQVKGLFDSGSSECFIHPSLVKIAAFIVQSSSGMVSTATSVSSAKVSGTCAVHYWRPTFICATLALCWSDTWPRFSVTIWKCGIPVRRLWATSVSLQLQHSQGKATRTIWKPDGWLSSNRNQVSAM